MYEITLACLPANIPDAIEVDVSALNLGDSVHASDLALPEGVVYSGDPEETVVNVVSSRAVLPEDEVVAEEGEGEGEGEGAEGAEGAPAGDDAKKDEAKAEKKEGSDS